MTKRLKILDDVADRDIPTIIAYHLPRSRAKAGALVQNTITSSHCSKPIRWSADYGGDGWRIVIFRAGTYALYYREMPDCWLIAGIFHAQRDPDWIQTQLLIRESREAGS